MSRKYGRSTAIGSPTIESRLRQSSMNARARGPRRLTLPMGSSWRLNAGLAVFCEKPLATSAADAHRLAVLAETGQRVLAVVLNRRFAPVYQTGKAAARHTSLHTESLERLSITASGGSCS